MNQKILNEIEEWFKEMSKSFPQIRFKYEFNEVDGIYKIIYYVDEMLSNDNKFILDVLHFEDHMNEIYGIKAPLFCENEELFSLSEEAYEYPYAQINEEPLIQSKYSFILDFASDFNIDNSTDYYSCLRNAA